MITKKRVVLYTRVSTDDQKDHGFSLQDQLMRLERFAKDSQCEIVAHFQDDHSAKNFNRPEFQKMLSKIQAKQLKFDYILVTRQDRFSRNIYASMEMINILEKFDVRVFVLDSGPLDYGNSNNFLTNVLAGSMAQHYNILLSENTKRGMRQAVRLGKWVYKVPKGYKKVNKEVVVDEKTAALVREGFEMVAYKGFTREEARRLLLKKGLSPCSKQNFLNMMSNPFYIGKCVIPEWKDEPEQIIEGTHEKLINEELFNLVQDIIKGKKKAIQLNVNRNEFLPLRGFLKCAKCGSNLTGSASVSRNKSKHFYYHCQRGCNERFRADHANEVFVSYLESFKVSEEIIHLYFEILKDVFKDDSKEREGFIREIDHELNSWKKREENLEFKFMDDEIDSISYKKMKSTIEEKFNELHKKRIELGAGKIVVDKQITFATSLLLDLKGCYAKSDTETKQRLIGSIFPEKIVFDGEKYRTTKTNELLAILTNDSKAFKKSENKKTDGLVGFSGLAPSPGLEPGTP